LPDNKLLQIVKDNKIGPKPWRNGSEIPQPVMPRRIDGGDLDGGDRRDTELDGFADTMINMAFGYEVACQLVIRGEGAVYCIMRINQRRQCAQVPLRAAFTQQKVQSQPQFLPRFVQFG